MKFGLAPLLCLVLAACAGQPSRGIAPQLSGGNRADGYVSLSSTTSIYNPVGPDWRVAEAAATRRCRGWGREPPSFSGWREFCRRYDRHGRCTTTKVTRFYACPD